MTQATCLRGILLPPSFHDLPMWSRACFWVDRIMFPSLCSFQLLCFAMYEAERKGEKKKTEQNWKWLISSKLGNSLAASKSFFFFFSPSEFSIVFSLDILLIIKIIIGKQFWSFRLHSTFFNAHWHYKHLLTSDLGINFLGYNIFAILHLNLPNIIKPFKWH